MKHIIVHEVGLRDGLQIEKQIVPFETKIEWINKLFDANVDIIQIGSFVHPEKVPQMADTDRIFEYYSEEGKNNPNTILSGLVLNEKGFERGMKCGVEMFCMGVSASETHSKKNTGMTVDDATGRIINIAKTAIQEGKKVQVSVQSAFGCGFEGKIEESKVLGIVEKYIEAGIRNISLADTAGYGNPVQVERMFKNIFKMDATLELTSHFHNTFGMGLANCYAALNAGATSFETAFGGLGGCPFTKLASGNICTEDFVHLLQNIDVRKDININVLIELAKDVSGFFERELPGNVYKAGVIKK